jgi:outer membrane protein OmpA-like peptidoglycan-associated protein
MRFGTATALSALALACVIGASGPALAQQKGVYVGLGAGLTIPEDSDITGAGINPSADLDLGWAGIASLGYAFGNGLRAEIEGGYRANDVDQLSGVVNGTGNVDAITVMLNVLYDFHNDTRFTPYIGAGVGWLNVSMDGVQPVGGAILDDSDDVLAYQGIVGIGYDLSQQVQMFVDYRYLGSDDANMRTSTNVGVETEYTTHTVLAGLRISLNPPAPPPPEPVAQAAPEPEPVAEPAPPPEPEPLPGPYVVFFDFDRSDLTPDAAAIIAEAAANAQKFGIAHLEVTGHADRSGSDEYNLALSKRRAEAVRAEFERLGVPADQIGVLWKGESQPLVQTDDGVREPKNRRVEIVYQ